MRTFFNTLFPMRCLLCDLTEKNNRFICDTCYCTLPVSKNNCKQCGITTPESETVCTQCTINPPPFDYTFCLFNYEEPISSFITQLKFNCNLIMAKLFSQYWIDYFQNQKDMPELIIPVPLHYKRLKERGFNQALEIAKPIGNYFNIPIDTRICIKLKNTAPQSSLSAAKRRNNLKNAFGLSYSIDQQHVAILDDVMTTGNTASEIALLLKKVGVARVDVWCCARAN